MRVLDSKLLSLASLGAIPKAKVTEAAEPMNLEAEAEALVCFSFEFAILDARPEYKSSFPCWRCTNYLAMLDLKLL